MTYLARTAPRRTSPRAPTPIRRKLDPDLGGGSPQMAAKHPEIRKLEVAGEDFRIVDHVTKAMRRSGIQPEEIEAFGKKQSQQKTATFCGERWVTLVPE
jgi:hypothetical protein